MLQAFFSPFVWNLLISISIKRLYTNSIINFIYEIQSSSNRMIVHTYMKNKNARAILLLPQRNYWTVIRIVYEMATTKLRITLMWCINMINSWTVTFFQYNFFSVFVYEGHNKNSSDIFAWDYRLCKVLGQTFTICGYDLVPEGIFSSFFQIKPNFHSDYFFLIDWTCFQ